MTTFRRIAVDSVPVGAVLRAPISDPNNPHVHLLTQGTEVTAEFLAKLRARGIAEVVISTRDLALINTFQSQGRSKKVPPPHLYLQSLRFNEQTKAIDKRIHRRESMEVRGGGEPVFLRIDRPTDQPYDATLQSQWANENDAEIEQLGQFFVKSCKGQTPDAAQLQRVCEDILRRLQEDLDALVCLAGTPFSSEYPSRHSVHLASMAMAIGVEMGLDHPNLLDLGVGCLIHDVGMQHLGVKQFDTKSTITREGLRRLADHPVHAIEVASQFGDEISLTSKLVAYQIHERLDGSGYPRGRSANQIHALARIAAVADTFVALLAPRSYRLGIQGYYAMLHVLDEVRAGRLDPRPVRALLRTTSMYPIGSFVELSNQQIGRVIRTGGEQYDRPTIEIWPDSDLSGEPEILNLQKVHSISIQQPIPSPRAA